MQYDSAEKSYPVGQDLPVFSLVKESTGALVLAGASDTPIGVTQANALLANFQQYGVCVTVKLLNGPGTFMMTAAGAISQGANVYAAANGQVAATGTVLLGIAEEAALEAGDQIEVLVTTTASMLAAAVAAQTAAAASAALCRTTTVAVANSGTPDKVAHITGQVTDANGNPVTGSYIIDLIISNASHGAPDALGTGVVLTGTTLLSTPVANARYSIVSKSDGTWGFTYTMSADGTIYVDATVTGAQVEASVAITG